MSSGDISRNLFSVFTPNYDWKVSPCENGGITSLKMSRISFYWNIHKATIFSAVCTWKFNTISVLDTVVEEVLWRRCPIGILLSSVLTLAFLCFRTDPCQSESCRGLSTILTPRDNNQSEWLHTIYSAIFRVGMLLDHLSLEEKKQKLGRMFYL